MLPPPVDAALLREHAYADTGNSQIVLDIKTFTDDGGYKPIEKYGLGYFNYMFALNKRVTEVSLKEIIRGHIYEYFTIYFVIIVIILAIWILSVSIYAECLTKRIRSAFGKTSSYSKKVDGISYDHVQV
ncbi:uncharacterized protein KLLA0_C02145g [Kluyveromyces lactis]|uniref:KLLA0C02145p n=1 Tax=Kluyveromyces lactis (strain ATCC 8585 / CBS 2359 / DSM 70799 / NBRC 1267 / NRRL Y-1140 / WM37) TaxID=284590 RepID=Q6CUU7_KLULA|nr:uncharacterized protein KLLA0_C02145g [Kluyveromyces lactis]CAH01143.1 KLLA0C02145p [Kluyveromyces lactis]|eukprot:XP_452292.1 uncharacterized protein KLLA0_C02145g [Kluyveromyces lactis]